MGDEKDVFYVVRKGDVIGVYNSLSDCQAQVGYSVWNPSVSVFKGYGLPQKAIDHLVSNGLKSASYVISAKDVKDDIFGELVVCPFQQPCCSSIKTADEVSTLKRPHEGLDSGSVAVGSSSFSTLSQNKHFKSDSSFSGPAISSDHNSCILEFDGASKGNPGPSGAGAVLRAGDGSIVFRAREGVGIATNNVAEYRSIILGLKQALKRGYKHIRVQGDSKLVCMQIQGLWKIKNENMGILCKQAKELKAKFISFQINHVGREFNSEADAQANRAIHLKEGQVEMD